MSVRLLLSLLMVTLMLAPCLASSGRSAARSVCQYEKLELTFPLRPGIANPFDPAQLNVVAEFRTPSGKLVRVPGFVHQPFSRSRDASGGEQLDARGPTVLMVRFAWSEVGAYRYTVREHASGATHVLGQGEFRVIPSKSEGFVRRSRRAPRYFQHDSGAPYFAIGENVCWPGAAGTYDYDTWLTKLAASGGNHARLWLINEWNKLGLEHLSRGPDDGNGLGRYDQEAAWRLDYIIGLAERLQIRLVLCIDSFNSLSSGEYGQWDRYPYNAAHSGPCKTTSDFFTDPEAGRLFRQRLRYLVARWGYATPVMAWEFWNEVDLVNGYDSARVTAWHREMATYLRSIDPWKHLITTSFAYSPGDPAVDALPQLDYVQTHSYGAADLAGAIAMHSRSKADAYGKPHYFGEFGIDAGATENRNDPEGFHLHEGLWASLMSGSAGTAMTWWWDNYVEPKDLYRHFRPIANFSAAINWPKEDYRVADGVSVRFAPGTPPAPLGPLEIAPTAENWHDGAPANRPRSYRVESDGAVSDIGLLSRVQHGIGGHRDWHNPATFLVDFPASGTFAVTVGGVSGWGGANLTISVDGKTAFTKDFADTDPDSHDTLHQYDASYSVEVPAGSHSITVENRGADWFYVTSYRLTGYLRVPNLRVMALANARSALVWVQNREHTWRTRKAGARPSPVGPTEIVLTSFTKGTYRVERWNASAGKVEQTSSVSCVDGTVTLITPAGLTTDIAYKISRSGR